MANPEVIRRQDLQRREAIFAGVKGRPAGDVGADVQKLAECDRAAARLHASTSAAQTREQQDAFAAMVAAMALAVIFIYIVLASQFGSFLQPIAIMASLPLALIGVMLALLVSGSDAEHVLDDRPGDADGPGDEERDPARRLRQPGAPGRRVGAPMRCCRRA